MPHHVNKIAHVSVHIHCFGTEGVWPDLSLAGAKADRVVIDKRATCCLTRLAERLNEAIDQRHIFARHDGRLCAEGSLHRPGNATGEAPLPDFQKQHKSVADDVPRLRDGVAQQRVDPRLIEPIEAASECILVHARSELRTLLHRRQLQPCLCHHLDSLLAAALFKQIVNDARIICFQLSAGQEALRAGRAVAHPTERTGDLRLAALYLSHDAARHHHLLPEIKQVFRRGLAASDAVRHDICALDQRYHKISRREHDLGRADALHLDDAAHLSRHDGLEQFLCPALARANQISDVTLGRMSDDAALLLIKRARILLRHRRN